MIIGPKTRPPLFRSVGERTEQRPGRIPSMPPLTSTFHSDQKRRAMVWEQGAQAHMYLAYAHTLTPPPNRCIYAVLMPIGTHI